MLLIWKTYRRLSEYLSYISFTFILLYLWESTQQISPILYYSIAYFATSILASVLAAIITNNIAPKISLLLSGLVLTIQAICFIYYFGNIEWNQIVLLGILGGLGAGLKSVPDYVLEKNYELIPEFEIQAVKTFWAEIIKLSSTFISAYIVFRHGGYEFLFQVILCVNVINSLLVLFLTKPYKSRSSNIFSIFKIPGSNPQKKLIAKSEFIDGIYEGINTAILPVALLYFVKDILDWGLVNTLLIVLSIFFTIIVTKTSDNFTYKNYYAITVYLFAMISVLLLTQYSIYILLIYMIIMTLNEVAGSIGYNTTIENLIDQDPNRDASLPEYRMFVEVFSGIGRLLPLVVMLIIQVDLKDEFIIQLALVAGSILPLIIISIFGNTLIFNLSKVK